MWVLGIILKNNNISANQSTVSGGSPANEREVLHADVGPVRDDVDEVEGQPGEEGDEDDADEEEESLLAPPVTFGVRSGPEWELGELQIYPGIVHQLSILEMEIFC